MPRCFAALFSVSHRLVAPWKNVNFTLSHSYLTRCDISCEAGQAVWRDRRRGRLVEHFSGTEFPCSSSCSSRRGSRALSCMSWLWWFSHLQIPKQQWIVIIDDDDEWWIYWYWSSYSNNTWRLNDIKVMKKVSNHLSIVGCGCGWVRLIANFGKSPRAHTVPKIWKFPHNPQI